MIIVIARVEVDPEVLPRLQPVLDTMMRSAWEETDCLSYSIAVENSAAGVVSVVARWADEAALHRHEKSGHLLRFNAAIAGRVRSMDAKVYTVTGERPIDLAMKGLIAV